MDYEKLYKEALEKARVYWETDNDNTLNIKAKGTMEYLFPELAESEGERIRKGIKSVLEHYKESGEIVCPYPFVSIDEAFAWLEKQGSEQKPTDKVEPTFKVGDWVVTDKNNTVQIKAVNNGYYTIDNGMDFNSSYVDRCWHLWTIQDAKDGDVLTSIGFHSNCTFIFKCLDNWELDEPNGDRAVATGYCCLSASADNIEFGVQGPDCIEVNTIKPATKIQRDLLFQKMKEAGYEWDADKKELKKIEPTDEYEGLTDFERALADICIGWIGEEPGWKQYIKDNADVLLKIAIEKFNSVQDVPFEQKPAWSYEDEANLNNIIWLCNNCINGSETTWIPSQATKIKHLIETIKERGLPQRKPDWSEEDEVKINRIVAFLKNLNVADNDIILKDADWLKSLKQRIGE